MRTIARNSVIPQSSGPLIKTSELYGGDLTTLLERYFRAFLNLPDGFHLILAIWSLCTFLIECFDTAANLAICGPTAGCGKTRLFQLLSFVVFNPIHTIDIKEALLFRILQNGAATLLIDEAEKLKSTRTAGDLLQILNSGFARGGAVYRFEQVTRTTQDQDGNKVEHHGLEAVKFPVFCFKAFALIGKLTHTLADRSIEIPMKKNAAGLRDFVHSMVEEELELVRPRLEQWAEENSGRAQAYYRANPVDFLSGREAEIWRPLFAVCAIASPQKLKVLESTVRRIADAKASSDGDDVGLQLLRAIYRVYENLRNPEDIFTQHLLNRLNEGESSWTSWNRGKGLDGVGLAKHLKLFGIVPRPLRIGGSVMRGYQFEDFIESWGTYEIFGSVSGKEGAE